MQGLLPRARHLQRVRTLLDDNPAVVILGARQVGKSTLAREIADNWEGQVEFFDLESRTDRIALEEPELALARHQGLVVLDEVQRVPDLFETLRVLIDGEPSRRFLLLGSAAPPLLKQAGESLAGRAAFHELPPFRLDEIASEEADSAATTTLASRLWMRGGFPRSYLAPSDATSMQWRIDFIRTFFERDLPGFGSRVPPPTFDRFLRMLAHSHGQIWNGSRIGSAFGISHTTQRETTWIRCGQAWS